MGPDPGHQPVIGIPHHAPCASCDASEWLWSDHQYRLRPRTCRIALQGGLCRGQARYSWSNKGDGTGDGRRGYYLQRDLPRICLHAVGGSADRQSGRGAWYFARPGDSRRAPRAATNKRFATVEELGALTVFLSTEAAASITGVALPVDGGWTAH